MLKITIPCECFDQEHEVEVEGELSGYGIRAYIGLYAPELGDELPCGRGIVQKDLDYIVRRMEEMNIDEG